MGAADATARHAARKRRDMQKDVTNHAESARGFQDRPRGAVGKEVVAALYSTMVRRRILTTWVNMRRNVLGPNSSGPKTQREVALDE